MLFQKTSVAEERQETNLTSYGHLDFLAVITNVINIRKT